MRYYSSDRNCCLDTCQVDNADPNGAPIQADINIKHPKLVSIRLDPRKNEFIVRSRISKSDICSFSRSDLDQDDTSGIDLTQLHGLPVRLLQDVHPGNVSDGSNDNAFNIRLPDCEGLLEEGQHCMDPDVTEMLHDIIECRKRQDELDTRNFLEGQQAAFRGFEAVIKSQADQLSQLVLRSDKLFSRARGRDSAANINNEQDGKAARCGSSNSSHSASSTTSGERSKRNKATKSKLERPVRSATTPLPKSALAAPQRKTSLTDSLNSDGTHVSKRVMFSEQEPMRIDAPHALDTSDLEDDLAAKGNTSLDVEDLFDMDEQVSASDMLTTETAFKRETSQRTSTDESYGSIRIGSSRNVSHDKSQPSQSLHKYDPPDTVHSRQVFNASYDMQREGTPTLVASLPQQIKKPSSPIASAPLSSIKDMPYLSPPRLGSKELEIPVGDLPPKGVSRKTMWKQAVADSLRMSGLLLPTTTGEEADT